MSDSLIMGELKAHRMQVNENKGAACLSREIVAAFENANGWEYQIRFNSRKDWFDFVTRVNNLNFHLKKAEKDEDGFPIFDESEMD